MLHLRRCITSSFLLIVAFFVLCGSFAYADNGKKPRRPPLSHLDFDSDRKKPRPTVTKPSEQQKSSATENVSSGKEGQVPTENSKPPTVSDSPSQVKSDIVPESVPVTSQKSASSDPKAVGNSLGIETFSESQEGIEAYPNIIPRLHEGPMVDADDVNKISTNVTWQRAGSNTCRNPGDIRNFCAKAVALKELLYRFSGNSEFFDSHCQIPCKDPGQKSVVHFLRFDASRGEELKVLDGVKQCGLVMTRLPGRPWMMLKLLSAECVCVPQGCEKEILTDSLANSKKKEGETSKTTGKENEKK